VLIVNGAQHGLAVTVMGLLRPGDVVAVDALTYSGFKALAALYHLELAAIPAARTGRICRRFTCCASSGACGRCIPCRRCTIRWAGCSAPASGRRWRISRQHDLLIIEDAAYASLIAIRRRRWPAMRRKARFISPVFEKRRHRTARGDGCLPVPLSAGD
jgi:hypothetical protein